VKAVTSLLAARILGLLVVVAALAVLSGCGAAGEPAGSDTSTTSETSSTAGGTGSKATTGESVSSQALAVGTEYARCARSHGVPSFPDPELDDNGMVSFPNADKADLVRLEEPCGAVLRRLAPPQLRPPTPGQVRAMRAFSTCMRSHPAAKTFPDPSPAGTFPIRGTRYDYQSHTWSAVLQAAWDACWHFTSDAGGWRPFQS